MPDLEERFRAAAAACDRSVVGSARRTPAETFALLARASEELGIEEWDGYAERGAVALLEAQLAELFGKPAVFFPSGTMAQQAALRVWCERRGSRRVALPDLAHQLRHEQDGPRELQGFRFEELTRGWATATVEDLDAIPGTGQLGAVQLELPLREAGCLLPTWDELVAFSARCRELGVPLHVDGARIWESQPHFDHTLAEIAALTDSMYVSFYKGLRAMSGAAVLCDESVAAELRRWRKRMGGTLYALTPYAVGALVGLRDELPTMGDSVAWAAAFARELNQRGLRTQPAEPQATSFLVFADLGPGGDADTVTERVVAHMERTGVQPSGPWWPAQAPGVVTTEVTVHTPALEHDPAEVATWLARIVGLPETIGGAR